jgi:catechol 2,3-dioxygenase-like lactoylglutathione lyase family enzyme
MTRPTLSAASALHLCLKARDLFASTEFYRRLLDAEPVKTKTDYVKFELSDPPLVLSLVPVGDRGAADPGPSRIDHLGLRVPDAAALAKARRRLGASGLVAEDEGQVTCCYSVQDKLWATDPDGNSWEVYHFLGDSPAGDGDGTQACCPDTACCP